MYVEPGSSLHGLASLCLYSVLPLSSREVFRKWTGQILRLIPILSIMPVELNSINEAEFSVRPFDP